MKRNIVFILSCIFLSLSFTSCSKDFRFDGITETDIVGQLLGTENADDWRLDDDWGNAVHKLFEDQFDAACTPEEKSLKEGVDNLVDPRIEGVGPAFPNPATSSVVIDFYMSSGGKVQVLLVDRSHNVIMKECIDLDLSYNYTLQTDLSDIHERGELYRFFYKHISEEGTIYGHGDVMVE